MPVLRKTESFLYMLLEWCQPFTFQFSSAVKTQIRKENDNIIREREFILPHNTQMLLSTTRRAFQRAAIHVHRRMQSTTRLEALRKAMSQSTDKIDALYVSNAITLVRDLLTHVIVLFHPRMHIRSGIRTCLFVLALLKHER